MSEAQADKKDGAAVESTEGQKQAEAPAEASAAVQQVAEKPFHEKLGIALVDILEAIGERKQEGQEADFKSFVLLNRFIVKVGEMMAFPVATVCNGPLTMEIVDFLKFQDREGAQAKIDQAKRENLPAVLTYSVDNIAKSDEAYELYRAFSGELAERARRARPAKEEHKIIV